MKRTLGAVAAFSVSLLLTVGLWEAERRSRMAVVSSNPPVEVGYIANASQASTPSLSAQAYGLVQAIAEPLLSLRVMQRAMAASDPTSLASSPQMQVLASELTTVGLGPIKIGMTLAEVADTGVSLQPIANKGTAECQYLQLSDGLEPISFMAIDGRILRIDVWPGSLIQTRSGVQIGSTEADVLRYYPDRVETTPNPKTHGKYLVFTPSEKGEDLYRLVFETDAGGKVVKFRAGQFPAVTWPDGCL